MREANMDDSAEWALSLHGRADGRWQSCEGNVKKLCKSLTRALSDMPSHCTVVPSSQQCTVL